MFHDYFKCRAAEVMLTNQEKVSGEVTLSGIVWNDLQRLVCNKWMFYSREAQIPGKAQNSRNFDVSLEIPIR